MGDLYRYPDHNGPAQFGEMVLGNIGWAVFQTVLLAPDNPKPYKKAK